MRIDMGPDRYGTHALDAATRLLNRGLRVHWERADPRLLPDAQLYDHERHAAAWLKHMEEKVVAGEPVASNAFLHRPEFCRGSSMAVDLLAFPYSLVDMSEAESDPQRARFEVFARGVLIGTKVSVGRTREVAAFLLGCRQYVPEGRVPEPRGDRLVYTRALDFGRSLERLALRDICATHGLVVTRAALVVVSNTLVDSWLKELRALKPDASIVTLTSKREHERCSYADIAMADVVLVSRQFLATGSYYRGVADAGRIGLNQAFALSTKGQRRGDPLANFSNQYLKLSSALRENAYNSSSSILRPDIRAPLLHLFAWPRLVVDEIHEVCSFTIPELAAISARFTIGISATLPTRCFAVPSWATNTDAQLLWMNFVGLCIRVSNFNELGTALACAARGVDCKARDYPQRWHYTHNDDTRAITVPLVVLRCLDLKWSTNDPNCIRHTTLINTILTNTSLRAVYWRNTRRNVERQLSVARAEPIDVFVPVHPLQEECANLLFWSTYYARDVPILINLDPSRTTGDHLRRVVFPDRAQVPLAAPSLAEYFDRFATMATSFLDTARTALAQLRKEIADERRPWNRPGPRTRYRAYAEYLEEALATLTNFGDEFRSHSALLIRHSRYVDEEERLYGTTVSLLFRHLDAIRTCYPDARCVVATSFAKALGDIFQHLHKTVRGQDYAVLGDSNLARTRKELERFRSGTAKVLLLDATRAASGMNIPMADYVFFLDTTMSYDTRKELLARAARAGRTNNVVVFHFRA